LGSCSVKLLESPQLIAENTVGLLFNITSSGQTVKIPGKLRAYIIVQDVRKDVTVMEQGDAYRAIVKRCPTTKFLFRVELDESPVGQDTSLTPTSSVLASSTNTNIPEAPTYLPPPDGALPNQQPPQIPAVHGPQAVPLSTLSLSTLPPVLTTIQSGVDPPFVEVSVSIKQLIILGFEENLRRCLENCRVRLVTTTDRAQVVLSLRKVSISAMYDDARATLTTDLSFSSTASCIYVLFVADNIPAPFWRTPPPVTFPSGLYLHTNKAVQPRVFWFRFRMQGSSSEVVMNSFENQGNTPTPESEMEALASLIANVAGKY
jgi:hypothetical protein